MPLTVYATVFTGNHVLKKIKKIFLSLLHYFTKPTLVFFVETLFPNSSVYLLSYSLKLFCHFACSLVPYQLYDFCISYTVNKIHTYIHYLAQRIPHGKQFTPCYHCFFRCYFLLTNLPPGIARERQGRCTNQAGIQAIFWGHITWTRWIS